MLKTKLLGLLTLCSALGVTAANFAPPVVLFSAGAILWFLRPAERGQKKSRQAGNA